MISREEAAVNAVWRLIVRIAVTTLAVYVVYRVRHVFIITMFAVVLACALAPAVEWFSRFSWGGVARPRRRAIAAVAVFVLLLLLFIATVRLFIVPFENETRSLVSNSSKYNATMQNWVKQANDWYSDFYGRLSPESRRLMPKLDTGRFVTAGAEWAKRVAQATLSFVGNFVELILIPVMAFYFVVDPRSLKREFVGSFARRKRYRIGRLLRESGVIVRQYVGFLKY